MATPTRVASYSQRELDFIERGFKQGLAITCKDRKAADYQRLRLYGLRKALRAEGHPLAFFADNVTMIVKDNILTISRVDNLQSSVLDVRPLSTSNDLPPLPPLPPTQAPIPEVLKEEDPMESALRKLGFFTGVDKREDNQ